MHRWAYLSVINVESVGAMLPLTIVFAMTAEKIRRTTRCLGGVAKMGPKPIPPEERFWPKVQKGESCWLWTGCLKPNGYASFRYPGGQMAHRFAYELAKGPIPSGLHIDHLCRTRACVNADHLEAVTCRTNILRGRSFAAVHGAKTHCIRGHPFDVVNTYRVPAGRQCKRCYVIRGEQYRLRKAKP